ncbi:MAG TPA: cytochrome c1, partial [Caulobacterales bacterium]|nr:cytochrome c1 [Caulobacterales bacterium]
MKRALVFAAILGLTAAAGAAYAETTAKEPAPVAWSFDGPMGTYDRGALQRGFQVYKEVCSSCHSLNLLSYRNLGEPGGPFEAHVEKDEENGGIKYVLGPDSEGRSMNANDNPYVKAIAADYEVTEIDPQTGQEVTRPARPSDHFHNPFPNDGMARAANSGQVPPDFSVLARARAGGPTYIHAFVTGFVDPPPAGLEVTPGKYYNPYIHGDLGSFWSGDPRKVPVGGFVAMPPQLTPDRVTYADGTKATPDQMARDVATFMMWAADPHMEARKSLGLQAMIYLLILTGLVYI